MALDFTNLLHLGLIFPRGSSENYSQNFVQFFQPSSKILVPYNFFGSRQIDFLMWINRQGLCKGCPKESQTEVCSWQWLTLSKNSQWEVVGQSR